MFQGFTSETFEFYMAIRFNNNREFLQANQEWYQSAVRKPLVELCQALAPTVEAIDPQLDTRPGRCVARINRDTRYARDKSPYRDHSFMKFRRLGEDRDQTLGFYFELSDQGASYGLGIYHRNPPMMEGLRQAILDRPERVLEALAPLEGRFALHGDVIKRMKTPPQVPAALAPWYPLRAFYLEKDILDFDVIKSPRLAQQIAGDYRLAQPLYRLLTGLDRKEDL